MTEYIDLESVVGALKEDYLFGIVADDGVTSFPSLKSLSESYNVSLNTLKKRAAKEKWSQQKKDIGTKITEKVHDKKSEFSAEVIVKTDQKFENVGLKALRLIDKKYDAIEEKLDSGKHVSAREFKDLGDALKSNFEVVKTAQGENPNDNSQGLNNLANVLQNSREKSKKKT